ncbi:uncharacterized protein LOC124281640 [Haliotis rubra]|uniref:uncharacterized protein LOC124281640 n=1 Tax=Haliotis rubra TaxID=36100 RepID=UPI001EE5A644|nr:uncharacterized protein LOC124281640 [Haliotis rubra]
MGGQRPIINLKALNAHIPYKHFKLEGLHLLRDLIRKGDYLCKLDLKDAYFSIPMAPHMKKLLRFSWKGVLYQFRCMPFGLAPAPRAFTFQWLCHKLEEISSVTNPVDHVPGVSDRHGGSYFDLTRGEGREHRSNLSSHDEKKRVRIRQLASLIGKLSASMRAILPAQLHCRDLQMHSSRELLRSQSYESMITLASVCVEELKWWMTNLTNFNGKPIMTAHPDVILQTDATKKGWGAICGQRSTGGRWSEIEQSMHINVLELKAIYLALLTFCKGIKDQSIMVQVDNQTAMAYVNRFGAKSVSLLQVTKQIWGFCLQNRMFSTAVYLPGVENIHADWESRHFNDSSDWMLNPNIFAQCNQILGPFSMDLFASRFTFQMKLFCSWRPDPLAQSTGAFLANWNQGIPCAFPPFPLVGRCLWKIRKDKTPVWQGQSWYPLLLEMAVTQPILPPQMRDLLNSPQNLPHPLIENNTLVLAAWKASGVASRPEEFQRRLHSCSSANGDLAHKALTMLPGIGGLGGAINGVLIPFQPLQSLS